MSNNVIQTSFAGGELSPTLYARVDLAKYHIGAARLLNFFVDYRGGASNRPGFQTVCRCKDSVNPTRLIPFQFSIIQTYELIFSNITMRVIKNGTQVLNTAKAIVGVTNANPGVFNVVAHGYVVGQQIYTLAAGMTQINNKDYFIGTVPDANHFTIVDWNGTTINTAGFGVFTSGSVASVYEAVSPYAAADLAMLKFTQSADTMTICHPSYPPYDLTRTSDTGWTFTAVSFGSTAVAPAAPTVVVSPATGGTAFYSYKITSVNAADQESVASAAGGQASQLNISTTAGSALITWPAVVGAVSYNVYKALISESNAQPAGSLYGYMTTVTGNSAVDTNIVPDFTFSPPTATNPFAGNDPIAVTYDQQRKVYAGSTTFPETFWMSKPGQFNNFDVSDPIQPSDSIVGTLVSRQVNNIKYMVSMPGGLIMLTGGGAWQVSGGAAGAVLTSSTITATPQAYNGCADVEPLTINYDILYVQQKGTVVRDLSYSFYTNIYTGTDLSVLSNHLFSGYSIVEWTYAEEPFKVIWAVRSDGALLSLTYLKEQEVFGWAKHETQGRFKSISSIQEGQENAVYAVVQRSIGGQLVSFVERMHTRLMPYGAEDAFFVDAGLSNTQPLQNATLTIDAPEGDGVAFTTDSAIFNSGMVGSIIRAGGGIATIVTYIDTQHVTCDITKTITDVDNFHEPSLVWPQAPNTWSITTPSTVFSGLDYLEGETVAILGDGNVFPQQTVMNGTITVSQPCTKVTVGLPYTAQLQTLYLDTGEPTIQAKRKNIIAMTARVDQTRGIAMGQTFDDLTLYKDRDLNTIGQPIELFTGDQRMIIGGGWTTEAQICIQQDNPLPVTVLGVIPEIQVGDSGK
jgi:hypothetical protein